MTQFYLHMGATNSPPSQFGLSLWLSPLGFSCGSETHESRARQGLRVHRSALIIHHCLSGLCDRAEEVRDGCAQLKKKEKKKKPRIDSGRDVFNVCN